jgi:hypothetical protein
MCSEGNRLWGASSAPNASKIALTQPPVSGRVNAKRSGTSRKHAPATRMASTIRRASVPSSTRSRHRNGPATKKRSIDMYGTIMSGTKGIRRSHSKYHVATSPRTPVIQLQAPYTTRNSAESPPEALAAAPHVTAVGAPSKR